MGVPADINIARKRDPEGDMSGAKESTQQKGKPVFELSRRHEEHEGWADGSKGAVFCPDSSRPVPRKARVANRFRLMTHKEL